MQFKAALLLFISFQAFTQNYLDLNKFISSKYDSFNDISYVQIHPQYEENQPANKGVLLEFYHGEFNDDIKTQEYIDFIKSAVADDRKRNKDFKISTLIYSKNYESIEENQKISKIQKALNFKGKTKLEVIPSEMNFDYEAKEPGRSPNALKVGRLGWTLIRGTATSGASFASFIITLGLDPLLSSSVAIWPGLVSGALTYHNGAFGDFLTNGKWSKWIMNSDKWFAKKMRKAFGINYLSLGRKLSQNQRYFRVKYPNLYKNNPELFERFIESKARSYGTSKFKALVKKLTIAEEYVKWFVTEVMFVGGVIKVPQAIAGIGSSANLLSGTADVLVGSVYGMLAQGPGDIAIQKRKFQKLDELLKKASDSNSNFSTKEKKEIIDQIKKVQDPKLKYQIGKNSHKALQKIENWARSRATMLSFFSVVGVSLEMAGIPAAKPILISTGIGGAFYYAQVSGWIKLKNLKSISTNAIKGFTKFLKNPYKSVLNSIKSRLCLSPFILKRF